MATQVIRSLATTSSSCKVPPVASGTSSYSFVKWNVKNNHTTVKFQGKPHDHICRMQNAYPRVASFRSHDRKKVLNAACISTEIHTGRAQDFKTLAESVYSSLDILFRFSRPYAAMATVLSVLSTSLLAVERLSDLSLLFFIKVVQATLGGIFMQIYVCGFNQICDIEIDKINKPYLPLASGELTMKTAIIVTTFSAIMVSLSIVLISGSWPLFCGLFAWFFVGTAYSANVLPFLRWKRFPYTAVLYMLNSRALAIPFGYYLHVKNAIRGGLVLSRRHFFSIAMLIVFSVVLILFKDIPDIKGDEMHGIKSLASQIGPERMFWSCIWSLGIAYGVCICVGTTSSSTWSKYVTILGHFATVLALWVRAKSVDLKNMTSVLSMYLFLWKLFYVEYLLLPLVR